ncbi:MAG: hypothetical protein IPM69_04930 [Ignavibacteria bacterium]|nr:hypothetical protein [Ignavibacteria bacterium]
MKKSIFIAVILLVTSIFSIAQGAAINTSRSNVRNPSASYTTTGGLVLTFDSSKMTDADKLALKSGVFIVEADITLTADECKAIGVPPNKVLSIKKGRYEISKINGIDTCKPGFAIKDNGVK